jgi:hypothetical protein
MMVLSSKKRFIFYVFESSKGYVICKILLGICKCYIPIAAVIIVFILCYFSFYESVAELKSPINRAPFPLLTGRTIAQFW